MPPIELEGRYQKAVLWGYAGVDEYAAPTVYSAVEIEVRWDSSSRYALDAKGNTVKVDGCVITDRDIEVGSILWLGAIEDLADPPVNLKQCIAFESVLDARGYEAYREATFMRFNESLPAVVGTGS